MNQYVNEEANWQRLKDIQREMEFSRLLATQGLPAAVHLARRLAARVLALTGLTARRAPRRHAVTLEVVPDDQDIASVA